MGAREHRVSSSVLVCDASTFSRRMLREILGGAEYDVIAEAETGPRAVDLFRQLRPRLVTMDLLMPGVGGIDALQEMLADDADARILVCSAMSQPGVVSECLRAGAREFVSKPFQPSRVLEAARRALG
jgi:two-component system, chemotaxis family, chemotaxis protein CheY